MPTIAVAEAPESRPATWDMSIDELQAEGLGQSRGDPIPVPPHLPREGHPIDPAAGGNAPAVIFVNFDGATLNSGADNSKQDVTQIGQLAGPFAAYGEGAKRDATLQAVRTDWSPFNVTITENRPASGDYTMNMTGPTNPYGGGVLGIAPLDCSNNQTHNNITYAFHSVNDSFSASTQATTIGQEVAHSYGLEHVDEPGDIMNPFNAGGDPSFRDQCIAIVGGGNGIVCGAQHSAECGNASMQNSFAELMTLFGPSTPDASAPTVAIVSPTDGSEFSAGDSFDIEVDASDDTAVVEVRLFSNGEDQGGDSSEPFGWEVADAPEGVYDFYVEASDIAGNVSTSDVVTVYVGQDAPPPDDGGGDEGGDDGGDDGGGGSASGSGGDSGNGDDGGDDDPDPEDDSDTFGDDSGLPPGYGLDASEAEGCACASGNTPSRGWFSGFFVLPLLFRRRR